MFQLNEHHIKDDVCLTRPPYRNGKKLRAIKVYTIAQESKYLLIQNIPSIVGAIEQLIPYFNQYGTIEQYCKLDEYEKKVNSFVDILLIKFVHIHQARIAKCKLDDMNFMGSILHICYAPEYENLDDLREKLHERRNRYSIKKHSNNQSYEQTTNEIRTKMRDIVQKSNLVSLVLEQKIKKKKRLQI